MNINTVDLKVTFGGQLSRDEFSRVQALMMPRWTRWYLVVPGAICLFVSTGAGWQAIWNHPAAATPDLVLAAAVLAAVAAITSFGRRKRWRETTRLTGHISGSLTEAGIEWNTDVSSSRLSWTKLLNVRKAQDLVLVFYSPRCAFYFPRSFFETADSWAKFNNSVTARVPEKR